MADTFDSPVVHKGGEGERREERRGERRSGGAAARSPFPFLAAVPSQGEGAWESPPRASLTPRARPLTPPFALSLVYLRREFLQYDAPVVFRGVFSPSGPSAAPLGDRRVHHLSRSVSHAP